MKCFIYPLTLFCACALVTDHDFECDCGAIRPKTVRVRKNTSPNSTQPERHAAHSHSTYTDPRIATTSPISKLCGCSSLPTYNFFFYHNDLMPKPLTQPLTKNRSKPGHWTEPLAPDSSISADCLVPYMMTPPDVDVRLCWSPAQAEAYTFLHFLPPLLPLLTS